MVQTMALDIEEVMNEGGTEEERKSGRGQWNANVRFYMLQAFQGNVELNLWDADGSVTAFYVLYLLYYYTMNFK